MEYSIEARIIDSQHLLLTAPVDIPPGSTVLVTIEPKGLISEGDGWYQVSEEGLEMAFGADEPAYKLDQIIVPNEDYQP